MTVLERTATELAGASTAPVANADPNRIDTPHESYARMMQRIRLVRALRQGTDAVRALGTDVLPQLEAESDAHYEMRKNLAALHPGVEKSIDVAVGLLLQREPVLDDDMSPELVAFAEDVDGSGSHLTVFCNELATAAAEDGVAGIFTDYSRADDPSIDRSAASAAVDTGAPLDAADEKALGLRPYFVLVKADEILRPVYAKVNGRKTLVLFVRVEITEELVEPFGSRKVTKYRAYKRKGDVVTCHLWEKLEGESEPKEVGTPTVMTNQKSIPWSPLVAGQSLSDVETLPTFMSTAHLVVQHHMIQTGMLSLQVDAMAPTMVRIGANADSNGNYPPITYGPRNVIEVPPLEGVQTPVYWTSPDVTVLDPAEKSLTRTETLIGLASASFLSPEKRAAETEKSKQLSLRAGKATLSRFGRRLQDCLELSFTHVANFLLIDKKGSVTVNLDFEDALMEADVMLAYAKLVEGGYPKRLALEALQLGGRIKPDANLEELEAEWEQELLAKQEALRVDAELAAAEQANAALANGTPPAAA